MTIQSVLLPAFVLVILTFALLFWSEFLRFRAVLGGEVDRREIALREPRWPPHMLQIGYAYESQLELPLLFYVLTILALLTKQADVLFIVLAWVFVVLRLLHAAVHVTTNNVALRATLFITGALVLAMMWSIFIIRILFA